MGIHFVSKRRDIFKHIWNWTGRRSSPILEHFSVTASSTNKWPLLKLQYFGEFIFFQRGKYCCNAFLEIKKFNCLLDESYQKYCCHLFSSSSMVHSKNDENSHNGNLPFCNKATDHDQHLISAFPILLMSRACDKSTT